MESSMQKETMKTKNDPEAVIKKLELTSGTAEREAKDRISWRKKKGCIILNGQTQRKQDELNKVIHKQNKKIYCAKI